jgi:hypothetical protein
MELPIKAKMKFATMIDAERAVQDQALSISRRINALNSSLATAPASEAASIEHEISRQRGKLQEAQQRYRKRADLNAKLRYFVQATAGSLEDMKPPKPLKLAGETLAAAVRRIRGRISALAAEKRAVELAALPAADAKKEAGEYIKALVAKGRPKITYGHGQQFRATFNAMIDNAYTTQADIAAYLAWLDPVSFAERIFAEIEAQPAPELALSVTARAQKLVGIEAELLQCEREEEALVMTSEESADGPPITRRIDADPKAILCIGKPQAAKPERIRTTTQCGGPAKALSSRERG